MYNQPLFVFFSFFILIYIFFNVCTVSCSSYYLSYLPLHHFLILTNLCHTPTTLLFPVSIYNLLWHSLPLLSLLLSLFLILLATLLWLNSTNMMINYFLSLSLSHVNKHIHTHKHTHMHTHTHTHAYAHSYTHTPSHHVLTFKYLFTSSP